MERRGDLRVGEGGLIGGSPLVSLPILPSLVFSENNRLSHSVAREVKTITNSCTYLFALFNSLHFDIELSLIPPTVAFANSTPSR